MIRLLLAPAAAFALIGADDAPSPPALSEPDGRSPSRIETPTNLSFLRCADRLREAATSEAQVTIDRRLRFDRRPTRPNEALAIWAVDRRENGCGVMVMMGNLNDVRPVPQFDNGVAAWTEIDRERGD